MQIKINNASFGFGDKILFENFNFEVNSGDKIAIIGKNGSGKTTLLKILSGEIELHQEENAPKVFEVNGNFKIGALSQMSFSDENLTLEQEMLKCYEDIIEVENKLSVLQKKLETEYDDKLVSNFSKLNDEFEIMGGYEYKSELFGVLSSFGLLQYKDKKLSEFSGGQKTKIAFIKLMLSKPDLLLLDEPTNHLDISAVSWLENYIKNYKKAVVIVSHDRAFIDNTVNIVYELEHKKFKKYIGGYTKYLETKKANYNSEMKIYEAQQREIADINAFIEKFRYKATKASAVQSRIKMLEKMQILPKPELPDLQTFRTKIKPEKESGSEVLSCTNLKIGYEKDKVLATLNFKVLKGERLGIIGGNGLGKSTLLKVITGNLPAISGHFKLGFNVEYGYFEQLENKSHSSKTIYEYFSQKFPDLSGTEVRSALGAFMFSGDDIRKSLNSLSGGELVRLELCTIFQKKPNLLILDEPTNHMDIAGKENLEELLLNYTGTVIFVSHDRYFTNKIATKLLVFDGKNAEIFDNTLRQFEKPFSKELFEKEAKVNFKTNKDKHEYPVEYDDKPDSPYASMNNFMLLKERVKLNNLINKLEEKSKKAEEELKVLNEEFVSDKYAGDFQKLMEIQSRIESAQILIDKCANDWTTQNENLQIVESLIRMNEKSDE